MDSQCQICTARGSTIFSDLASEDLQRVGKLLRLHRYKRHQVIFLEGDVGQSIYLIKAGAVKISRALMDGREQSLRILGAGDILGWEALFEEGYSVTAESLWESEICSIVQGDLAQLLAAHPTINWKVLKALFCELMKAQEKILDLGLKNARERVATLLLSIPQPCCRQELKGQKHPFSLSRREISELIGTAQETVSRVLSELRQDEVIGLKGRDIVILDRERLAELAGLL